MFVGPSRYPTDMSEDTLAPSACPLDVASNALVIPTYLKASIKQNLVVLCRATFAGFSFESVTTYVVSGPHYLTGKVGDKN